MLPGLRWACAAVVALLATGVQANELVIPKSWQNTMLRNVSQSERDDLTMRAVDALLLQTNPKTGVVHSLGMAGTYVMLATISSADQLNGKHTFQGEVLGLLDKVFEEGSLPKVVGSTEDLGFLGLATYHAWQAYDDNKSLERTVEVWETLNMYAVSPAEASVGHSRTRVLPIAPFCDASTTAGGVFFSTGGESFDTRITGKSTGAFLTLSALLYNTTSNSTFGNAAQTAAQFIQNHLFNGTIVLNSISLSNCIAEAHPLLSSSSGLFIEGISYLAVLDPSWYLELGDVVSQVVQFPSWTNRMGLQDEDHPLRALLPRALSFAHLHSRSPSLSQFIESYLNIQFNALSDTISQRSTDSMPAPTQLHTLVVLQSVDQLHKLSKNSDHDNPGHSTQSLGISKSEVGLIIGATIGGVAALLLLFVGALLFWRRYDQQRRQRQLPIGRYPPRDPPTYRPSSTGFLSTVILPPDSDRTSRSRTTIITSEFYPPVRKPASLSRDSARQTRPPLWANSEKGLGQKENTPRTRETGVDRSAAFSKAAQAVSCSSDGVPHEDLANATTILNRIVTRLALNGHSVDAKAPTPHASLA